MRFSKALFFALIPTALFLTSCDTKRTPYLGDDDEQFYVSSISKGTQNKNANSDGIVAVTKLSLTACLKTLANKPIPPGLAFDITAGTEVKHSVTDRDGCIFWTEEHSFDPNVSEMNLRLRRTVIAKNEYNGKKDIIIYWNPWTNSFGDNLKTNDVPENTQDPVENGFSLSEATQTIQSSNEKSPTGGQGDLSPSTSQSSNAQLFISSISFDRIKLNSEQPYKVDQNLTLSALHNFRVSADPKLIVGQIGNVDKVVSPPLGRYKLTLVFMSDPQIDFDKLTTQLNQTKKLTDLAQLKSPEGKKLKAAASYLISQNIISDISALTRAEKKQILVHTLLPNVHSTVQFIGNRTLESKGIRQLVNIYLHKFAQLDVRSILSVTIENISEGQKQRIKGHSIGYIRNLLDPGTVELEKSSIEADQIYSEFSALENRNSRVLPLDLFLQNSLAEKKEKSLSFLDKQPLSYELMQQSQFENSYPFLEQLEAFLQNKLDGPQSALFNRALCTKLFVHKEIQNLAKTLKLTEDEKQKWAFKCQDNFESFLDVKVLDFVTDSQKAKVTKIGKSIDEKITITRSFEKLSSEGTAYGEKSESSLKHTSLLLDGGNFMLDGSDVPLISPGAKLSVNQLSQFFTPGIITLVQDIFPLAGTAIHLLREHFPISSGSSWYYSSTSERSDKSLGKISRVSSRNLNVNIDTFKINVDTLRCAVINYQPWVVKYLSDQYNVKLRTGYIACALKPQNETYQEKYYTVTQDCSEKDGKTDCASDDENQLRMMLRGEMIYDQFNNFVNKTDLDIVLNPADSDALDQNKIGWKGLMDALSMAQLFPGVFLVK
jgi:predicted transposase YbfD/YdcC